MEITNAKWTTFTFHNVYIKTAGSVTVLIGPYLFTFHNVYIKTLKTVAQTAVATIFTFHNVYIKTTNGIERGGKYINLHSIMFILKPIGHQAISHQLQIYIP